MIQKNKITHHSLKKMGKSLILNFKELRDILGGYTMLPHYCKKFNYFLRVSLRASHVICFIYTDI